MMIWNSNTYEISPLPPKVYDNDFLLNNTRPTHLRGKNELKLQGLFFYYQTSPNFVAKSMVEINPCELDDQNLEWKLLVPMRMVIKKKFGHHTIGHWMFFIATRLVTKNFQSPHKWWLIRFNCHRIINWISITTYGDMMCNSKWLCHIDFDNLGCKNMFLLTFY